MTRAALRIAALQAALVMANARAADFILPGTDQHVPGEVIPAPDYVPPPQPPPYQPPPQPPVYAGPPPPVYFIPPPYARRPWWHHYPPYRPYWGWHWGYR